MGAQLQNQDRRILVVDDDPQSVRIVTAALSFDGYQVESASSGQQALALMRSWDPHLVLLDVQMPGLNGLDTLEVLRTQQGYVSCLFVSGKSDVEDVIRGLDAGADDYVCKPFDVLELLARVRSQLRIKDLNDRLQAANAKLKELVDIDDLTGLFNMRSLYKRLDLELDRARRYIRQVSVVMMDMDHFKRVNDSHDHLFGSYVLSAVGKMIQENMRKVDFAARYGGDEFLVVLAEIDEQGTRVFAERLRECIGAHLFEADGHKMALTASLGFAIANPSTHAVDARTLVRLADRSLYRAKDLGRDRVEGYNLDSELGDPPPKPHNLRKAK